MFILGAGASAPFGVPTLKNIFKEPNARYYLAQHPGLRQELEQIFWQPRGHHLETSDQSITIEEILTIIRDYDRKNDATIPPLSIRDIVAFKRALYILIIS